MIRGIYTSATGMQTEARRLDVVANNLANANTTGYKRDTLIQSGFQEMIVQRLDDRNDQSGQHALPTPVGRVGFGVRQDTAVTRLSDGALRHTGSPLDVALVGDGFFAVRTPLGVRYTRDGSFRQDARGRLVTQAGYEVLVNGRPVGEPGSQINITEDGIVRINGNAAGTLQITSNRAAGNLRKAGANLWATDGEGGQLSVPAQTKGAPGDPYQLRVGFLEAANVDPVHEMVEMIAAMRSYEANQKAVQAQDQTLEKAVNEVGKA